MEVLFDKNTVTDAGFDKYLNREFFPRTQNLFSLERSTVDASSLVGGIIGEEGEIYLGSKQVRLDGRNKRIVINDGTTDRVIIGYLG